MKKQLLTLFAILILVLSSVLIYHMVSDQLEENDETIEDFDSSYELSNEFDNVLISEDDEIDIGDII